MNQRLLAFALILSLGISFAFTPAPPAEVGMATFYDDSFHGRKTACNGQTYNKTELTAAHKTLPCGTMVKVTHMANKKTVTVRIIDRGPYIKGQVISLSRAAAEKLDLVKEGQAKVKLEVVNGSTVKDTPAKKPDNKKPKTSTKKKSSPKPAAKKAKEPQLNIVKDAAQIEKGGLYKMQVLKLEPKGFGVQVAGYSDYESVVQQVAVLQKNWFKGAMVFADQLNGKPYYKIIMGPFFTKGEADSYCDNLKKKYKVKGAFVVDLEKMKASN